MPRRIVIVTALLFAFSQGCTPAAEGPSAALPQEQARAQPAAPAAPPAPVVPGPPAALTLKDVGFSTPESVLYDEAADVYLVSNINGSPLAADGNGFISRVSPEGKVLELKWIDGERGAELSAPKGMGLAGGTLYVADLTAVRLFDRASGAPRGVIEVKGATFLNDVAVGAGGLVYVSDSGFKAGKDGGFAPSGTDAVYRLEAGKKAVKVIAGPDLGAPNGLAAVGQDLVVVTFGSGAVFKVSPAGARQDLTRPPAGALDGVVVLPDGRLLISSWAGKSVYALAGDTYTSLAGDLQAPADIGLDTRRNRLLVPLFMDHGLVIRPL